MVPAPAQPQTQDSGRSQRKLKNYLLDARFQLKFAAYFVVLTLVVAALLGAFLVRTTDSLFTKMNDSVDARSKAVETSRELGVCSLNNELTRNMNDPQFTSTLEERSKAIDATYEAEKQLVLKQRTELVAQQQVTVSILIGLLVGFIVLIAFGAIVITHRIVGPLFRIKRMAREVAQGALRPPSYGLRPGDELQDLFEVIATMIASLRAQAESDLQAVAKAQGGDADSLQQLKTEYERRLAK